MPRATATTYTTTPALLLGRFAMGEADEVTIALTATHGQVRLHTPGARSSTRMHASRFDTGNILRVELRHGSTFFHTQGAQLLQPAPRGSLAAIGAFGDWLRLVRATCPDGDTAHAQDTLLLSHALSQLLTQHAADASACQRLLLAACTLHLTALGFLPVLNTCSDTGTPLRDAPTLYISLANGLPTTRSGTPLPLASAKALYYWQHGSLHTALSLALPADATTGAALLLSRFAEAQLHHRPLFSQL